MYIMLLVDLCRNTPKFIVLKLKFTQVNYLQIMSCENF